MQTTKNILMVRPCKFSFNKETEASNAFQVKVDVSEDLVRSKALKEFEEFVKKLKTKGVNVFVFDDTQSPHKPDAIFPNNWVTFHDDGTVILYPMCAENRQYERRTDIVEALKKDFKITNIVDLSKYEKDKKFLEGTGSIIFYHNNKIAYACLSPRTNQELFIKVCNLLRYDAVFFHTYNKDGKEIYHTNVMMCVGDKFAVVCLDSIFNEKEKQLVSNSLTETGHKIIEITFEQMNNFSGNMLEIGSNHDKSVLVLSQRSFDSLKSNQKNELEQYCELLPVSINTIETVGGGSARCMMAEIFLPSLLKPLNEVLY